MGGDHAPAEPLKGAIEALKLGHRLLLVGQEAVIRKGLAEHDGEQFLGNLAEIIHAAEVVEMDEAATTPIKKKKNSSIRICAELVKSGRAAGFVSAGNTGALVTVASLIVGRIEGVERTALTAVSPTEKGPTVLLDVGATTDCKPEHLLQFAQMGVIYAQIMFGKAHPKVGLMSVGSEDHKGNDPVKETHALLKVSGLNFIGNVEGTDLFKGKADIIVTDGFTGNVLLKTAEGMASMFKKTLKHEINQALTRQIGAMLVRGAFKAFEKKFDDSEFGGALLMGAAGICIKAHGKASAKTIRNAVKVAHRFADAGLGQRIHDAVQRTVARESARNQGAEKEGMEPLEMPSRTAGRS